jgi:hypothetical protein
MKNNYLKDMYSKPCVKALGGAEYDSKFCAEVCREEMRLVMEIRTKIEIGEEMLIDYIKILTLDILKKRKINLVDIGFISRVACFAYQ